MNFQYTKKKKKQQNRYCVDDYNNKIRHGAVSFFAFPCFIYFLFFF